MLHAAEEHATFTDLGLSAPLIEKLQNLNITTPTAIQVGQVTHENIVTLSDVLMKTS